MDYLLSLSDAAKDKLGDEIVSDDTVSDNQQQGSGNVDTAAIPDAQMHQTMKRIYITSIQVITTILVMITIIRQT